MNLQQARQNAYERCVNHLIQQNAQSTFVNADGERLCAYRSDPQEDGRVLMCAVGCLLPDDQYSAPMEGYAADMLFSSYGTRIMEDVFGDMVYEEKALLVDLLGDIQLTLHDSIPATIEHSFADEVRARLPDFAKCHDLNNDFMDGRWKS